MTVSKVKNKGKRSRLNGEVIFSSLLSKPAKSKFNNMKNNYHINRNPKKLSSEEIARHKDFDALLKQFRQNPSTKRPEAIRRLLFQYGGLAVAAVAVVLYFAIGMKTEPNYLKKEKQFFAARPFVQPPLPIKPTLASFKINANKGGVFEYESGSKLIVPPASFIDAKGNLVEGRVNLRYREFHDYVDFFLSGIPMVYDSAGVRYTLESAGMMELFAEKDGQRVKMAPSKTIAVELVSNLILPPQLNVPPNYNIYKLNEKARDWVYQDIDKIQLVEDELAPPEFDGEDPLLSMKQALETKLEEIEKSEAKAETTIEASIPKPQEPVKPLRANGSGFVFDFDLENLGDSFTENALPNSIEEAYRDTKKEVAEMKERFESMLWQVSPQSNVTEAQLKAPDGFWDDMRLRKLNNRDYELTLIEGTEALKVIVNPVLSGSDYERALEEFDREFADFTRQMEEREAQLRTQKEALQKEIEEKKRIAREAFDKKLAAWRAKGQDFIVTREIIKRKVINRFRATSFGIWNCDRPLPPQIMALKANFVNQHGEAYENNIAYLVDKSRNTVVRFLAVKNRTIHFNRHSENLLWLVTKDNKIAVFRPDDFKRINEAEDNYQFVLNLVDREIKTEADVREILYF